MYEKGNKKIGAVLVLGGGIAGVQASLDLAGSGFKVYLIEREPAIGGIMARLDKTFPTGDCATCIISPKLVECARNLNIEILTLSEIYGLEGDPGNFSVSIKRFPGYVDENICNDCGECSKVCPVDFKDRFNSYIGRRKAIDKYSLQAVPSVPNILKLGHAPCKTACPANINVQGYIQLIKKKEYVKAVNLIRKRNPLSAICGRVCTHPCETACTRINFDSAVAIRLLKRFASDKEIEMVESGEITLPEEKIPLPEAQKVAVIGAGPSGLTVADDLADRGYAVTVYESSSAAGGMLRWGIPEYRLPAKVLDYEIELIRRKGVTFIYNCIVGKDIPVSELREAYEAFFIGTGMQKSVMPGLKGENLNGVMYGIEFLRHVRSVDDKSMLSGHVVVIGGGDVAMDAARTAIRLGAENVSILYRRSSEELPALQVEIEHAKEEGVDFKFLTSPVEFIGDEKGGVNAVKCINMELGEPDESGRRRPVPIAGSEFMVAADRVILAIGSQPDTVISDTTPDLPVSKNKTIITDENCITEKNGVFAGGDIVTGPATVIGAVAAGKKAAESIDLYLRGVDQKTSRFVDTIKPVPDELLPLAENVYKRKRNIPEELPVQERRRNFDEVEAGFSEEEALEESKRCLNCGICSECGECVEACEKKAIDHNMKEGVKKLNVGSVILTSGYEEFQAEVKGEFGFNRYSNVVTSVQFERMLSASGPFEGHVKRISDGQEAKRIAWIQCVGSRDLSCGNEYCSSVCCMVSTKQALVAREHIDGLKAAIFYIDIRAHGKDFDQYYEGAKKEKDIQYIKSIPSRIVEMPETKNLRLCFINDEFETEERDFDLVVLSVGMEPAVKEAECALRLGIELNEFGFCATDRLRPLETSRPGVFVAGAFQEPKDIPETVTQASGAAAMAMELLAKERDTLITRKVYPPEHDITDEAPRIGVFVCHCGINIASVVDVEQLTRAVSGEPGVIAVSHTMFTCSDTSLSNIKDTINEHRLNRIVVASCTPRTHEPLFRETLREAGLNPYLFELANIRDQCSWVHPLSPEMATRKAIDLVKMSIARANLLVPLEGSSIPINKACLVIGGGMSGMIAALSLARQGFKVYLIEISDRLGGNLLSLNRTLEHENIADFTADLVRQVEKNININIFFETRINNTSGHVGKFNITLLGKDKKIEVTCGAIIVAAGAIRAETSEYLYGDRENIVTQVELEKMLHTKKFSGQGKNVVMIQCVGSRNDEHPFCSRICCSMAVKNALTIKGRDPDANVFIIYRDIRTYGFRETYYKRARDAGVIFIRYNEDTPPSITYDNGLTVSVSSPELPDLLEVKADYAVLSTGVEPPGGNKELSEILKVPLNADGFFVEAHLKLRPVDFTNEGIFLCGLAHSPKFIDENIAQARAAAARAATLLSKTHLDVSAQVSMVNQDKCISCMTCVKACPYSAPFINTDNKAEIAAAKCMGCGICASECPARAIQLNHFITDQFKVMIDKLFPGENGAGNKIIAI